MILQVHDELLFDMWKSEEEIVVPIVKEKMQTAIPMSVPIKVDIGIGHNWLEAH
jgi:DNA polymerase-1